MFIGEVSVLDFSKDFYVIQSAFFLMFIFFMVIVLMNLLNALAVADANEMLEDADMEMLHGLLVTVTFWENLVHGDPHNRFQWAVLPLSSLARLSWWPSPEHIKVLPENFRIRFLPHRHPEGPSSPWRWLGMNRCESDFVRVENTREGDKDMWVEREIVKDAIAKTHLSEQKEAEKKYSDTAEAVNVLEKKMCARSADMESQLCAIITAIQKIG